MGIRYRTLPEYPDWNNGSSEKAAGILVSPCANASMTNKITDQDIDVDKISGQVGEPRVLQFLLRRHLPAEVTDRRAIDHDERRGRGRMFPDRGKGLFRITPPLRHVGSLQPLFHHGQITLGVERRQ